MIAGGLAHEAEDVVTEVGTRWGTQTTLRTHLVHQVFCSS